MHRLSGRTVAYSAFLAFCILSSARDAISEVVFKDYAYNGSPVFVLFVYSAVTQVVSGLMILTQHSGYSATWALGRGRKLGWLNLFTLTAFLFYFLAIYSPLGAATNAFVDYGSSPVFTAIVGALLTHTKLDRAFAVSSVGCLIGIAILGAPRVRVDEFSLLWLSGLSLSLLSSISSAFYRTYFKLLLVSGASKSSIIFSRLLGTTFLLGVILLIKPELFRMDLLLETIILGLAGFTIPLFLTLIIVEHITIPSFAMLLFLVPALTFLFSASLGYAHLYASDFVAAALVMFGVFLHERHR